MANKNKVLLAQGLKYCASCNTIKTIDDFPHDRANKDGHAYRCRICDSATRKEWRSKHPETFRLSCTKSSIKRLYGLSWEEYNDLLERQDNRCAICGEYIERKTDSKPCVDHSHVTGKTRGILCLACNFILGQAKDNKQILQNAIDYLSRWENN
jgi:hypothetical protein